MNGLAIRWRNGLQRVDAAFHGGPRAVAPRSGSSVDVIRNGPPQRQEQKQQQRQKQNRGSAVQLRVQSNVQLN